MMAVKTTSYQTSYNSFQHLNAEYLSISFKRFNQVKGSIREFDFKLFEVSHIRLKWQERFIDRSILQAIEYAWLLWLLLRTVLLLDLYEPSCFQLCYS